MISLPRKTTLVLGTLAAVTVASTTAFPGDISRIADRCAVYGSGFVDLGNGTCGQVGQARVGDSRGWTGGAASAGYRSDGLGMLPGAGNARHLHVQTDPDFR